MAVPVILSNLLQTAITVIDTIMIGQLGPISIAAVGMGNTIRLFLLITILSVSGGAISLMAQAKGSRDRDQMSLVTQQALLTGLILALLVGGIGIFLAKPLLTLMNQGGEMAVIPLATNYLYVIFLGTPFLVLNILSNRLMQGAGDTITPLVLNVFMLILNVGLNYIFIFGWQFIPAYGVVGAAIGTVAARGIIGFISLALFYSGKNVVHILAGTWRPNKQMIKDILSIGVPSGIQGVFRHGSNLMMIGLVTATSLGTYGAAVIAIGTQIEQLLVQPIVGINVAATSLIGQDLGKWQTEAAYQKGIFLTICSIVLTAMLVVPSYFYATELIEIFDPSGHPLILEGSISFFKWTFPALIISAIGVTLMGTMRGAGDTKPAMYSAIINRNIIQLGIGWFLAFPLGIGYVGLWIGVIVGRLLDAGVLSYCWAGKKWAQIALEKTLIYRTHLRYLSPFSLKKYLTEIRAPLMAQSGTKELVVEDEVVYQHPNKTIRIEFEGENYRLC